MAFSSFPVSIVLGKPSRMDWVDFFESGELYDCTIRVGSGSSPYKVTFLSLIFLNSIENVQIILSQDFKCHKYVLSMASDVFKAMFFGHFKEATMGPDEPILLDYNVDPLVFKFAMKLV
jgi:BTB/POZ domain